MAANADIFLERDNWGRPLAWSLGLHGALLLSIVLVTFIHGRPGDSWGAGGGGGGAISANLVTTIPLPSS